MTSRKCYIVVFVTFALIWGCVKYTVEPNTNNFAPWSYLGTGLNDSVCALAVD